MNETFEQYRDRMAEKTVNQLEREIASWRAYMQKHSRAYAWHGAGLTPPDELSDGDRLRATRDALEIVKARQAEVEAQMARFRAVTTLTEIPKQPEAQS